jgi:hypothetical protein
MSASTARFSISPRWQYNGTAPASAIQRQLNPPVSRLEKECGSLCNCFSR